MSKESTTFNFEEALEQLTALISQMEKGQLSLEQSLQQFEQGIRLIRQCQQTLNEAEQKIAILIEQQSDLQPYAMTTPKEEK